MIGPGVDERLHCFTMEILYAYHNIAVTAAFIHINGHTMMVFRAPYYPFDGPIEYAFNTLQTLLRVN